MNNSLLKKLSREQIGTIPAPKVIPTKKEYSRKKAKLIPEEE